MTNQDKADMIRESAWKAWVPIYEIAEGHFGRLIEQGMPTRMVRKLAGLTDAVRIASQRLDEFCDELEHEPDDPYEGIGEGAK